uniref:Uncharacterized protein n=2 Tax=Astyanax mexicanus TaxID=7994 RepID=A0A8B9LK79_ASTMX
TQNQNKIIFGKGAQLTVLSSK